MTALFDDLSAVVTVAGLLCLAAALRRPGHWRAGLGMAVELWTAAGLLRLAGTLTWSRIATVAAIVAVRRVVTATLRDAAAIRGA